jgi:hypothetical protein
MAGFNLNGLQEAKDKYSTDVLSALLDDSNLLDITQNKELQTLILKTSGKLLSLITLPDNLKSLLPENTLSDEEKLFDNNPADGELDKQETKAKIINDFKKQFETTVLGKFNLKTEDLVKFKDATKEERKILIKNYIENNPKFQSLAGSIATKVNLFNSLIDKQLDSGKELFDLIKSNERVYVSGIVIDELTGDPIKGAQVKFSSPNYEDIRGFSDITNRKGKFTIEIPSASFSDPLAKLTPEEIEQVRKVSNILSGTSPSSSNIQLKNNSPLDTLITNNPILINFNGSVYLPDLITEEPDNDVTQTTLTGSNSGSAITTSTPNPITQPDLSGYTLYSAKDENGTPTQPLYSGLTDLSGSFNFSIPKDIEYISISKGSGTNLVLYSTFNASELDLETSTYLEIPNPQSNNETLSNTTVATANGSTSDLSKDIITIKKTKYTTGNLPPYKGNGTVKDKVIVKLTPIIKTLEEEKINALLPNLATTQELTKDKKDAKWYQNEKLAKVSRELASTMLPVVLVMAASFGVSELGKKIEEGKGKLEDLLNEVSCPTTPEGEISKEAILKIIAKKNKLVKQLNNTLNIINTTTKALSIAGTSIEIMNASYMILKNIPIPTSTGAPGVPGLPINVVNNIEDTKIQIDKTIASLRGFNLGLLATLVVLRQTLVKIISYLNALDNMIQFCSPEASQEPIAAELLALTIQQAEQTSPVVVSVNGFDLAIETEPSPNTLKRRRAIAKNKQNVVMLQGEWSFSSIDQILMDELVFYIQVNNLKAD